MSSPENGSHKPTHEQLPLPAVQVELARMSIHDPEVMSALSSSASPVQSTYSGFGGQQRMKTDVKDFERMDAPTLFGSPDVEVFTGTLLKRTEIGRDADHRVHGAHMTERELRIKEMYGDDIGDKDIVKEALKGSRSTSTMSQRYRLGAAQRTMRRIEKNRNKPHSSKRKLGAIAIKALQKSEITIKKSLGKKSRK